ncbi:NADP-dependent oxidoreductase [Sphingopyxis sp.]|uniref:NADP-dependent oxidoreductase n=1 Tax=Sphingopyxis sp. TaxID=1908224 RepID=UPI0026185329|nr:NADP-dependent oxidoreductase [Sphingopyxis sp.]MCW0199353.1 NADP-dependent oxidoreductase [Sphingopyxis sp.]
MRAMIIEGFGDADVLHWGDLPTPESGPGEVLVRVACAGVNPADWKTREGKLSAYIDYHFPFVLGFDLAGVVEAAGDGVDAFRPGDRVFGMSRQGQGLDGSYAEYCLADAAFLAPLPSGWSFAQAAALPVAGTTAYGGIVDAGALREGQQLLINGGAGGVGSIGIQVAKALGARVAVTCGADNQAYVRGLGAELAIDYRDGDVVAAVRKWAPDGVDLVLDAVGLDTLLPSVLDIVAPGGRYVEIETLISRAADDLVASAAARDIAILSNMVAVARLPEHLKGLAALCGAGQVTPPAIETMPLGEAAAAHRRVEAQHVRGKIILEVAGHGDW